MSRLQIKEKEIKAAGQIKTWRISEYISPVVIEDVKPELDAGQFPIKRVVGEFVEVSACVHAYGHNLLSVVLIYRHESEKRWHQVRMSLVNKGLDLWVGQFQAVQLGVYEYTLEAWIDTFANWKQNIGKKIDAGQEITVELLEGALMLEAVSAAARAEDKEQLIAYAQLFRNLEHNAVRSFIANSQLQEIVWRYQTRQRVCRYSRSLRVTVEPERARFSAWYEMFPRSCVHSPSQIGKHGTFTDVMKCLPYIKRLGFDVLYLPPIHPIGITGRKGANNSLVCKKDDPGSPWAIGAPEGGHMAIHPKLGTLEDFEKLVAMAKQFQIEVALDFAIQCSPDHPYVHEHPEWFYHRPDGSIRFAENPPKKYEDIFPLDFECSHWPELWQEMRQVMNFWIGHGVKIFRVDNPHTKPYQFWCYLIEEVKSQHPEVIFLSEAFSRPPVMKYLAKCGFSQSYTYFTWRNTKQELTEYLTELTQSDMAEYLRPNLFVNTPDILHAFLQHGGRRAFLIRLTLAATMGSSYGIYGPPFELCVNEAIPGTEEYKNSEKYQVRYWDRDDPASIAQYIGRINQIRHDNSALRFSRNLRFVDVDNDQIIAYVKVDPDHSNIILTVVDLDYEHVQSGWVYLPVHDLGLCEQYQMHDLITGERFNWQGISNYVELNPNHFPAHIFEIVSTVKGSNSLLKSA